MITVRVYGPGGGVEELGVEGIEAAVGDGDRLTWVEVVDPSEDDLQMLEKAFSLHPLAMEDVRERHQRAKLEHYPSHGFIVAYTSDLDEIDLFVGRCWLISVQETRDRDNGGSDGVETAAPNGWTPGNARQRFERTKPDHPTVGFLLYVILDDLVDTYFEATERAEDTLEELEERIFAEQLPDERAVQHELFRIRRRLLVFRRAVVPLREVLASLLRGEVEFLDEATLTHLQDVYDHVLRAVDSLDSQRELMGNAVDAHLAIISNRMNQVMKTMTSWGAILLGSTLVAGIYGMNFEHMPELQWRLGYPFALAIMATVTVMGYRYFSRKDWL